MRDNNMKNEKILPLINEAKMAEWELKFVEPRKVNKQVADKALPQKQNSTLNKCVSYFC
ncbi:hypothetical protein ACRJXQ_003996 [Morganella morganii]|uniref:hypothetical protein n=1 Tax=Morganella morganii TaxID=582 RepID=UPI00131F14D1|nr:hypothetical protein [Morganella morganii]HAT3626800.1 hypothetical protein [Morganella morganii]HCR3557003.1 hypothetical protein [Morganella morganii]HCR3760715.1 hypothetical protein [Morganella morganii]HCT5326160.1 hypothetical protein [Morganella morganii]HEI8515382.1 hypothetical protein [Morganella morganii]